MRVSERQVGRPLFEARGDFDVTRGRIVTAPGDEPAVDISFPDGSSRRVSWIPPSRDVPSGAAGAALTEALKHATSDQLRTTIRRRHAAAPVAGQYPALRKVRGDGAGGIWVQRYPRPGVKERTWFGFDGDGTFRCALVMDDGFDPLEFRGETSQVVGVVRDLFDVEYVEVRRIRPAG